ncbi:thioesterase family protein [Alkalibacterium sp.]|nr:MAG: hypothetical protein EA249_04695 [Alkalibacterium sp.]
MSKKLEKEFTVKESETAQAVGSGGLPVLSTPHMIAYMENTAMTLMQKELEEGETSVGMEINVNHLAPTALKKKVAVKAEQTDQNKGIYTYKIEAFVDNQLIGKATHKRAVVNEEKFMNRLN